MKLSLLYSEYELVSRSIMDLFVMRLFHVTVLHDMSAFEFGPRLGHNLHLHLLNISMII